MLHRFTSILLVLLLSTTVAAAQEARTTARYLVLEIDANDSITLLDSKRVSVAVDPTVSADPVSALRSRSEADAIDARLVAADGSTIAHRLLPLDRYLRAEYATAADGTISGRWIAQARTQFVVRMPAVDAAFVDLEATRSGRLQRITVADVDRLARIRSEEDLAAPHPGFEARPSAVGSSNRLDLLVLGDGYTSAEAARFYADVEKIVGSFLGVEPYASYSNYVGVSTLFVPSPQSGADHPDCADGGVDPKEGTMVDTAFDATYCSSGLQRLLTVNYQKVLAAAAAIPDWDKIIVIVNDSMYGGAGGSFSVSSTHSAGVQILQHEYGHSFTRLADEYSTPYPGYPDCSDLTPPGNCEANATDVTSRSALKWSQWVAASTPIPVPNPTPPAYVDVMGLFEGARYKTAGMYRPKFDCLMNHLGASFCSVCAQSYVLRLYSGWNGVPAGGINPIEPGTESPAQTVVSGFRGQAIAFSAQLLRPVRGGLTVQWLVNGAEVATGAESYSFVPPAAGTYTVELRVTDTTALVRGSAAASLSKSRKWTVTATEPSRQAKRRSVRS